MPILPESGNKLKLIYYIDLTSTLFLNEVWHWIPCCGCCCFWFCCLCCCSAWISLKLNTKIGLHITHHHHTNPKAAISQLLLTRFWSNLKHTVLGTSTTKSNCHGDICPGNICPYQQYLSCYWSSFVPGTIFNKCQLSRWHLSRQRMSWQHLSISVISQLILTQL